jgi:hypothetical protein
MNWIEKGNSKGCDYKSLVRKRLVQNSKIGTDILRTIQPHISGPTDYDYATPLG